MWLSGSLAYLTVVQVEMAALPVRKNCRIRDRQLTARSPREDDGIPQLKVIYSLKL
jgi:hypothetical protein